MMILSAVLLLASCAWFDADVSGSSKWPLGTEPYEMPGTGTWDGRLFVTETGKSVSYADAFDEGLNFAPAIVRDAADGTVTLTSKMTFAARKHLADPADDAKAAITVLGEGTNVVYCGLANGAWVALEGAKPVLDKATEVTISLKTVESALFVRYTVEGTVLTSAGEEWLASDAEATEVTRVSYCGRGSVSTLLGAAEGVPTCVLTIPETIEGMSVVKVSVGGVEIAPSAERAYDIPTNAFVTVTFEATKGYILAENTMLFQVTQSMELPEEGRPTLISPTVITINEFLASPDVSNLCDWVELRNATNIDVNVAGWLITDDPTKKTSKWKTIEGTAIVPANGYLVVYLDKDTETWPEGTAHAALGLSDSGDALGLATPDGKVTTSSFAFDIQFDDVSCGFAESEGAVGTTLVYFREPTPGAMNDTKALAAPTRKVVLSEPRGWKNAAFDLTIAAEDGQPGGIRYTLDGSAPTLESPLYAGPINVSSSTVIRAGIPVEGESILQRDASGTYLFVEDVVAQSTPPPEGFPADEEVNGQKMRYGMSTFVTEGEDYDRVREGFTNAIPTLSMVIDPKFLFDADEGIYVNALKEGEAWERMALFEQIDPVNGTANEWSAPVGVRIRGGSSRNKTIPKHSFRLYFRRDYGMNKLKFPLFGDEGAKSFKKIDLRTSQNFAWAQGKPGDNFIYECVSRDLQGAIDGDLYTRTRTCHLFINGVYWGLYQTDERIDDHYAETYNGGDKAEYDVARTFHDEKMSFETGIVEGNELAWKALWKLMDTGFSGANYPKACGLSADYTRNPEYAVLLNPTNLMHYMMNVHWGANTDTPATPNIPNNVAALRNRIDGNGARDGFMFVLHDCEHALGFGNNAGSDRYKFDSCDYGTTVGPKPQFGTYANFAPAQLHYRLCANAEYKMAFADQVYRHAVKKGGVLTAPVARAHFEKRMAEVDTAISCEAARWGWDCPANKKPCHELWLTNCLTSLNFIDKRTPYFIAAYRKNYNDRRWYPQIDAPTLSKDGEELVDGDTVSTRDALEMVVSDGATVYYTLDGSDPRLRGGALNPAAKVYDPLEGLTLPRGSAALRARAAKASGSSLTWSALESVDLTVKGNGIIIFVK